MTEGANALAERRTNAWLDFIRSVAIVLVLLRHGQRAIAGQGNATGPLETLFLNGWIGVDLFFVLSGYLITEHLFRAGVGASNFQIGRYLAGRMLRIVPAYLAVTLLVLVSAFPYFAVDWQNMGVRVAYHLLFLQDYLPSNINVPFWSLGVEAKFYLLAPILITGLLACRLPKAQFTILLVLASVSVVLRLTVYDGMTSPVSYHAFFAQLRSPFHTCLEALLIGVVIAFAQRAGYAPAAPARGLTMLIAALLTLLIWLASHEFMRGIGWFDVAAQPVMIALLCGGITFGAVSLRDVRLPMAAPFRHLSRLSYTLYLVHFPLIPLALWIAAASGTTVAVFWFSYVCLSFLVAWIVHRLVERPCLKLRDRLFSPARAAGKPLDARAA